MTPRPEFEAVGYEGSGDNAAYQQHRKSIEDLTDEQLERAFATNVFGYFYVARAAVARMQPGSAIVNTGSITGLQGSKELLDYSATKAPFTRSRNRWRRIS